MRACAFISFSFYEVLFDEFTFIKASSLGNIASALASKISGSSIWLDSA